MSIEPELRIDGLAVRWPRQGEAHRLTRPHRFNLTPNMAHQTVWLPDVHNAAYGWELMFERTRPGDAGWLAFHLLLADASGCPLGSWQPASVYLGRSDFHTWSFFPSGDPDASYSVGLRVVDPMEHIPEPPTTEPAGR